MNVASYIDHTVLKPTTVLDDIQKLCDEAREYKFAAVCVPPPFVRASKGFLTSTDVNVATVIGFPFGYSTIKAKLAEVEQAIEDGADELDVVINISVAKSGLWKELEGEMKTLLAPIHANNRIIKVIIESGVLTDDEIVTCCRIYGSLGVDYVKTSTGYAETGATLKAVQLIRASLPSHIKIKASGGIRTYDAARQYIEAGASRIGCSAGVAIIKEQPSCIMNRLLIIILFLSCLNEASAQGLDSVVVNKDPRVDLLVNKQIEINELTTRNSRRAAPGYRIMVISSNDRKKVIEAKTKMYREFPELKTYMTYQSPFFRLKIGNFREREAAEEFLANIQRFYPTGTYIVTDTIEVRPE